MWSPKKERHPVSCRVYDVSEKGIGVIVEHELRQGMELLLVTLNEKIPLVVNWCAMDQEGRYLAGLSTNSESFDFQTTFSSFLVKAG